MTALSAVTGWTSGVVTGDLYVCNRVGQTPELVPLALLPSAFSVLLLAVRESLSGIMRYYFAPDSGLLSLIPAGVAVK